MPKLLEHAGKYHSRQHPPQGVSSFPIRRGTAPLYKGQSQNMRLPVTLCHHLWRSQSISFSCLTVSKQKGGYITFVLLFLSPGQLHRTFISPDVPWSPKLTSPTLLISTLMACLLYLPCSQLCPVLRLFYLHDSPSSFLFVLVIGGLLCLQASQDYSSQKDQDCLSVPAVAPIGVL